MHKVQLYAFPPIIDLLCGLLTIGIAPRRINAITQGRQAFAADMALLPGRFSGNSPTFRMGLQSRHDLETALYRMDEKLAQVKGKRIRRRPRHNAPVAPPPPTHTPAGG